MSVRQAARLVVGRPAVSTVADIKTGDLIAPHLYDLYFDGVNQYARVAHSPSLDITSAITIAALVYPTSLPSLAPRIVSKEWSTYTDSYALLIRSSDSTFCFGASGSLRFCGGSVKLNAWQHVAVAWNNVSRLPRLYIDGSLVATGSEFTGPMWSTTYDVTIGNNPTNIRQFSGLIASVLIYSRALTSDEISQSYSQKVVSASGLRLFIDPTFFDGAKYVDLSGNGNHAYPYNAPSRVPAERSFVHVVRGRFDDGVARVAVPPRCSFVIDGARQVNVSSSPVFVPVSVGRHLFAFESLDAEPWLVLKAPDRVVPASRTVSV